MQAHRVLPEGMAGRDRSCRRKIKQICSLLGRARAHMLAASVKGFTACSVRPLVTLIRAAAGRDSHISRSPAPKPPPPPAAVRRLSVAAGASSTMASSAGLAPRAKAVLDYWWARRLHEPCLCAGCVAWPLCLPWGTTIPQAFSHM